MRYHSIPDGLRRGFHAGIPKITTTYTPENHSSLSEPTAASFFTSLVQIEFDKGRYIGPFTTAQVESLLGPFQTSPLSLVPKSTPGKFRLVQNLSFPYSPIPNVSSINSHIDADDFPCTWGTFTATALLLSRLPPGCQAAARDIREAYRNAPLEFEQFAGTVIRLLGEDSFAINTAVCFGLTSAGGVWGLIADALADIFRAAGIGPVLKWVDDFLFIRLPVQALAAYNEARKQWSRSIQHTPVQDGGRLWFRGPLLPDGSFEEYAEDLSHPLRVFSATNEASIDSLFAYSFADINNISDELGVPWADEKDSPFSACPRYIGFDWHLETQHVRLPPDKKEKYVEAIRGWLAKETHTLDELERLYGRLLWAANVVPVGRAYLTRLEAFFPAFRDRPYVPRRPPRHTSEDLQWWIDRLSRPCIERPFTSHIPVADVHAFSDASSDFGIAITVDNVWRAWRWRPGWDQDGRDIAWAEAVGVLLLAVHVLPFCCPGTHVLFHADNSSVVFAWNNFHSRNQHVNAVFRQLIAVCKHSDCSIQLQYIPSAQNLADAPSRGLFPSGPIIPQQEVPLPVATFLDDCSPERPVRIPASLHPLSSTTGGRPSHLKDA